MLQRRQTNQRLAIGLIVLQAIALLVIVFATLPLVYQRHTMDMGLYYEYSLRLMQGQMPYRDFAMEYPPLALLPFTLPRLAALGRALDFSGYVRLFLLQNAIYSTLVALTIVQILREWRPAPLAGPALALYALLVAVSAPLLPWRYDLFPALLTALALLCLLRGRPAWAGFWLGCGVAAKLYPIVLLPIFGAYYLAGRDRRALARLALGGAIALAITLLPFALADPRDLTSFLRYHELRGLQIESLPAGAIVLAHVFGRGAAQLHFSHGALNLVSPLASAALKWLPLAFLAVFGVVSAAGLARFRQERAARGAIAHESLAVYMVAALLAFIATNKVFSPQYLIWLLPFAPLLRRRHAGAILAIFAITIVLFPFDYDALLAMHLAPVLLLNLRNLLVAALLIWLLIDRAPALSWAALPLRRWSGGAAEVAETVQVKD
ncbi:MAG TPA: glycosyltransferase 87 family protein [Roseiflexaceae bacterium]